jgi:hypothetical protein
MNAPARDRPQFAIEVREIEQLLRAQVEALVWQLLPNAKRDGHYLCVGSLSGEPGQSLKINVDGPNRGMWADFAALGSDDGGGDCLLLIAKILFRGELVDAIKWAKSWLGLDGLDADRLETKKREARASAEADVIKAAELKEVKRKRAVALWMGAKPIAGTPAEAYLRGRGIDVARLGKWPGSLKFHAEVWNREQGLKIPAMIAQMVTPAGVHVASHRTYLRWCERKGWVKLDSPNAKMVLGACAGSFIPLRHGPSGKSMSQMPEGEVEHMAEGIEDCLTAAMAKPEIRIDAGYSLGNIGSIVFPEHVRRLVLLCDRDEAGSKATDLLERVIARQQARGMHVQYVMPPVGVKDLNLWLQRGARAGGERAA